ncbi:hydroxymethylglutaryl-CoA lyase [Streptomyces hygroscopicus subsp. hygroscopicus]|uniref:Hydroxymethylglutaryl-CoA lyase n=1 Tax=Streptomyces demainii TaxID=588122 RepID=A0ABT9KSL4_9ACTN|nr:MULTISPECIES: hydroxymethylglutaryl-CoA lyase [Streptomyces]MBW8092103.1 hydroxymethylglutaryl-CoA lyase [Streptomyces hygroscopicus subsp. hygroscopicus]MDP9611433.1 hydroxymethylglutaryl-CoA lyase [Streptomyces demainii]
MTSENTSPAGALPRVARRPGLPEEVRVYEVGPRDGLQAEAARVPTAVKAEFVRRLAGAGLTTVEVTSFVSPRWIPQLDDAHEVLTAVGPLDGVRLPVLVPNDRGLERALAAGAREIAVFASATDSFARNNLGRDVAGVLAMSEPVVRRARSAGLPVRGYVSMCFGDPWEGDVEPREVASVARGLMDMGCTSLSLGDTIGTGTPGHVLELLDTVRGTGIPLERIALHFHDTYGQALANVHAALTAGITEFDSSAGGIGGCPYARSATGNLATEDLVWMLRGLGIRTGVDLTALAATSRWMAGHLGRPSPSRVVTALS